jgi:hypothetical protein
MLILHRDNANTHTSAGTTTYLTGQNFELLDHAPYSPDFAPRGFFIPTGGGKELIRRKLRGQSF